MSDNDSSSSSSSSEEQLDEIEWWEDFRQLSSTRTGRARLIAAVQANNPDVVELHWERKELEEDVVGSELLALAEALPGNEHLEEIVLDGNYSLRDDDVRQLLNPLRQSAVRTLGIHDRNVLSRALKSEVTAAELANRLRAVYTGDPAVTSLDLMGMYLRDEHMPALAAALTTGRGNQYLVSLDVSHFEWTDDGLTGAGFRCVLHALEHCVSVREVSISCQHRIRADRCCCLALQDVCVSRSLARLAANNPMLDKGGNSYTLTMDKVWHAKFGDVEALALADALEGNTHLQTLELPIGFAEPSFTEFTTVGARALEGAVSKSCVVNIHFHYSPNGRFFSSCSTLLNVFNGTHDRAVQDDGNGSDDDSDRDETKVLGDYPKTIRQACFDNVVD
jgi:hypothetical protein